ncbi:MAG: hypothetical protein ABSA26_04880 [Thermoguttaceae bacterium]
MQELEMLLDADPMAQEFYVDFLTVNAEILWLLSARQRGMKISGLHASSAPETNIPNQSPILTFLSDWSSFFNQHSPLTFILIFLFLGLAIIAPIYYLNFRRPADFPVVTELVAQITEMRNCQWSAADPAPEEAEQLSVGRQLQLEKGLVQITYSNKAVVLMEGPVSYTVDSPKSGFLSRGKLTARADTEQSRQFTIVTPNARFVDMGTEFGVAVEANGRAAIAVFAGKIIAEAKKTDGNWTTPIPLQEGQAGVYEQFKFTRQVCKRSDFPTLQLAPPPPTSYQRWLEASRELRSRPGLVAYYDFQPDPNNTKVLLNRSPSGAKYNGEIQNAAWVGGRFQEKSALEFMAQDAGVRVNLNDKYEQITLVTWVNISKLANTLNGLLLSNDWSRPGQLHWEINSDKHIDVAEFTFNGLKNTVIFQSKEAVPDDFLNQWSMISLVIDRMNKRCFMYVNEKCILSQSYDTQISVVESDVVGYRQLRNRPYNSQIPVIEIGSATIGGWLESGNDPSPNKVRSINCRMDELMIFESALSPEEIQKIYEAGKP